MAWIESHQSLRQHPKVHRLRKALGVSLPAAIGHLHCLWWWALDYAAKGDLTEIEPETIADACAWEGDPIALVSALTAAGFLDDHEDRLAIHDWDEYAGRLIDLREHQARRQGLHRDSTLKQAIRDRDGDGCRYCAVSVDWKDRKGAKGGTYDHLIPHGPNTLENVVVACRSCNSRKNQRTPEQAGMSLLQVGSRTGVEHLLQKSDKSTLPNPTVPNSTVPNSTRVGSRGGLKGGGGEEASSPSPQQTPEQFSKLSELPGFNRRNHSKAYENIETACAEAGVSVNDVVDSFAPYYRAQRFKHGWKDPVKALAQTVHIEIGKILRPKAYQKPKDNLERLKELERGASRGRPIQSI